MEQKKLWKRLLSVILSVSMVVGLITVSGPNREITLTFNGTYSYAVTDMECNKKTGSGQSASFTVGAGEAVLVVVE